jgi:hypothetical protein
MLRNARSVSVDEIVDTMLGIVKTGAPRVRPVIYPDGVGVLAGAESAAPAEMPEVSDLPTTLVGIATGDPLVPA